MAEIKVPVNFVAQFGQALLGLDDFARKTGQKVDSIESKFSTITTALGAVAGFFAISKLVDGLEHITEAASEAEQANNRMVNSLKAAGDYSERNAETFRALSDELARTTRFDDDLILSQVALAKQFNTTNKEAAKLIRAATDLAVATGEDLPTAVQQLGQTLDGTVGRVGQLIPSLQTLTAEQLRAGAAIDIVGKRFRGFAEGDLQTFEGAATQAKKSFNDFIKAIGSTIVENKTVIEIFNQITQIFQAFTDVVKENKLTIVDLISNGVLLAIKAFGIFVEASGLVISQLGYMVNIIITLTKSFGGLVEISTGSFKSGLKDLKSAIEGFSSGAEKVSKVRTSFDGVAQKVADISVSLENATKKNSHLADASKKIVEGFDDQTNAAKRFDLTLKSNFETLQKDLKDVGATELQTLTNVYNKNIALIQFAQDHGFINEKQKLDLLQKLRLKYVREEAEKREAEYNKILGKVQAAFQNPTQGFLNAFGYQQNPNGRLGLSSETQQGAAAGLGLLGAALQGKEGARNILSGVVGAVASIWLGPLGQVVGQIVGELSKGREHVKAMIDEFINALPEFIANIIESLPDLYIAIFESIPKVIEGLADRMPEIIDALIKGIPRFISAFIKLIPQLIVAFVHLIGRAFGGLFESIKHLVSDIVKGAGQFISEIVKGAGRFITELIKGIGKAGGSVFGSTSNGSGIFGSIGKGIGDIGKSIGGIFGGGGGGLFKAGGGANQLARISPIASKAGGGTGSHQLVVNMQVSRTQFAKTVVDLKRYGYRLEPV